MKGSSLYDLEKNIMEEIMTYGRVGIFTDYVKVDEVSSKADLSKTKNKYFVILYCPPASGKTLSRKI